MLQTYKYCSVIASDFIQVIVCVFSNGVFTRSSKLPAIVFKITLYVVPVTRCSTIGDRAFPVAAARAWNTYRRLLRHRPDCRLSRVI